MLGSGTPAAREDIASTVHAVLNYEYQGLRGDLLTLYEKAKQNQWNASTDIDWSTSVDVEKGILEYERIAIFGTPLWEKLDDRTRAKLNYFESSRALSQLLHGEQGALLTCGQLVDSVPDIEELGFTDIKGLREAVLRSPIRKIFRKELFSTLIPNLRRVGLLPERLRPHYAALGVLEDEDLPASA